ncbi:MAG TPA: penicillin acylase family protein, partial [Xanthomonadales bacterium]|nr:penicillin acylase family protein [Xanthomonadales bacterium]
HAQERYFEMDRMRRFAAGELSEVFGARALELDRKQRMHRFRARAQAALAADTTGARAELAAYTAGVNAGLAALATRPFPYLLAGAEPAPWRDDDAMLVGYAMFFDLHDEDNARELAIGRMREVLPRAYVDWVFDSATEFDAPILGGPRALPALPPASAVDLRALDPSLFAFADAGGPHESAPGSNNFAVGGALTAHGGAIVENDMHLGLRVPNLWFRARLRYTTADGQAVDVTGASLPGVPAMVVGSNGRVAWGYTNSYGDWLDWVVVRYADAQRTRYRTPEGDAPVVEHPEPIAVKGEAPVANVVRETRWGPILHEREDGTALALAWTAHVASGQNLAMARFETARDAREVLDIAKTAGMPPQNVVTGDADGHIGWTVSGYMPARAGIDPHAASAWDAAGTGWNGAVPPGARPEVLDPPGARLWTANARVADEAGLATIGDGGYALGLRARQIRDALRASERFDERALLAIALDDTVTLMPRWHALLRDTLAGRDEPALASLRAQAEGFAPRATADAAAYDDVRAFRLAVIERIRAMLAAPMRVHDASFVLPGLQHVERIAWQLASERPAHLLAPRYADWDALLLDAATEVAEEAGKALSTRRWGDVNAAAIRHPMSAALPGTSWLLDAPRDPLAGDTLSPRAQAPAFGASQRMVVAPGREQHGLFHMPGGQSGHPLSPFYLAGHDAWVRGEPTPFLPGPAQHRLAFTPSR